MNTSIDTEHSSSKKAQLITVSTNDDLIIAPNMTENNQSQSIFNKIGTKFGDTFRKNEDNNYSIGQKGSVFPPYSDYCAIFLPKMKIHQK